VCVHVRGRMVRHDMLASVRHVMLTGDSNGIRTVSPLLVSDILVPLK
jgi:hypothetical protein